jgi:tetrahydromethanopterin S-methyltransferase subunit B
VSDLRELWNDLTWLGRFVYAVGFVLGCGVLGLFATILFLGTKALLS